MSIDVMKQALEALEYPGPSWPEGRVKAADALRLAIEQAEKQEPVAWMWERVSACDEFVGRDLSFTKAEQTGPIGGTEPAVAKVIPLYTAPPQRQPLTEEQIENAYMAASCDYISVDDAQAFARAIERAHGIGGGE